MSDIFGRSSEEAERDNLMIDPILNPEFGNVDLNPSLSEPPLSDEHVGGRLDFLPSANELEAYERVLPGAAQRLLEMSEKKHQFHIDRDKALLDRETLVLRVALRASAFLSIAILAAGVALVLWNAKWIGGALCGTGVLLTLWLVWRSRPKSLAEARMELKGISYRDGDHS